MCFSTAAVILSLRESSSNTAGGAGVSDDKILRETQCASINRGLKLTESQFFQGAVAGLGIQEVDDAELEKDPAAVDGEVLPLDGVEGNRVDVGGEETGELAKNLLDTDTTAAVGVGPELDQVGCFFMLEKLPMDAGECDQKDVLYVRALFPML